MNFCPEKANLSPDNFYIKNLMSEYEQDGEDVEDKALEVQPAFGA